MAKTKNIKEIYDALPESSQRILTNSVAIEGRVAYTTAWRYVTGQMKPLYLYRKLIAERLSELTGKNYTEDQLGWKL